MTSLHELAEEQEKLLLEAFRMGKESALDEIGKEPIEVEPGVFVHPLNRLLSLWCLDLFDRTGAENFVTTTMCVESKTELLRFELTIRRHEGIAPAEKIATLEARIKELEAKPEEAA